MLIIKTASSRDFFAAQRNSQILRDNTEIVYFSGCVLVPTRQLSYQDFLETLYNMLCKVIHIERSNFFNGGKQNYLSIYF